MDLIKNKGFIYPKHKKDLPLFKHCSGGLTKVKTRVFNSEVKNLLWLHGLCVMSIEKTKEKCDE